MSKTGEGGQQIRISVGENTFVWVIKIQSPHSENSCSGAAGEGTRLEEFEKGMQERKVEVSMCTQSFQKAKHPSRFSNHFKRWSF